MAATGPTGPAPQGRSPAPPPTKQADGAHTTSSTRATPATKPVSNPATKPANLPTTKAPSLRPSDFQQPQTAQVVRVQAETNTAGQTMYRLTLSLSSEKTQARLQQILQQSGLNQIDVLSKHNYPVGRTLTLQSNAQGQLQIQDTNTLKQQLMATHFQTLNRVQSPVLSVSELGSTLNQLVQKLHQQIQTQLNPQATTQIPGQNLTQSNLQITGNQHLTTAKMHVQVLQQLIQILGQLKATQIPIDQLNGTKLREHITNSGLFFENHLTKATADAKNVNNTIGQTDLKATLLKLDHQLKNLARTATLLNTATGKHTSPTQSGTRNTSALINTLNAAMQAATGHRMATQGMNAATQLTTLLRAVTHPEAGAQTQQAFTQAIAVAALLAFWGKLGQTSASSKPAQRTPDGWATLFTMLFAGPRRIPRKPSATNKAAAIQTLSATLTSLLSATQTQLNILQAKQLWLANQQERPGEFKTLLTLDIPIQFPSDIQQTPLRIDAKDRQSKKEAPENEKVWKIQLGFDLAELGLIKALGLFSAGKLDLTFQTQTSAAKNMIEKNINQLSRPLSRWGISISNLQFAPYTEDPLPDTNTDGILQKIVDIKL